MERFSYWFRHMLKGDLGESLKWDVPVSELLKERFRLSLILAMSAITLACLIALPLGTFAALKQGTFLDPLITLLSQLGAAVPPLLAWDAAHLALWGRA
ncbi:MAG: hypothetical protein R2880_08455 [Deinococcales bacterium]